MIWELLEKVSQIDASQIKSPTGRVFQKYMYSSFMVKIRINLRSFGLFFFTKAKGIVHQEGLGNFEFWGSSGQKVQI